MDVSGACRHVMWNDIFTFLLQEGITGSPCKHEATHREGVIGDDKGIHSDLFERTGSV